MKDDAISAFVQRVSEAQGKPALSEAKVRRLSDTSSHVVVAEGDSIQAVAVAARHRQPDGTFLWELETVVEPSLQFAEFEIEVLRAGLWLVPRGTSTTVWSQRSSLDTALATLGFEERRALAHMAADLPLADTPPIGDFRPMGKDERGVLVELNNAAFAGHPEAGTMTIEDIDVWEREGWFRDAGVIFVEHGGVPVGFCVTKVHPNGDGEIYRVGVVTDARGRGYGTTLAVAAYDLLARDERTARGTLWVDSKNEGAVALYRSIGLETTMVNREFSKSGS